MEIGKVQNVNIDDEMREAYLDYAMSVIVARAIPDARDGLKPVHRRILYAMHNMGIRSTSSYKKSARIVGEVLGKYHPHSDAAVYETMARLAQDFSMRYPMIDGQGNFGSIDGDAPAAMRYTEARLSKLAEDMLVDIEKDTVDFNANFDGSLEEPIVLPSLLPNLLLNGSSGIAVGMATSIPPHNLKELVNGLVFLIDNYENMDDVSIEDLLEYIPGPDFPTGGEIIGGDGIRQAYSTGRGKILVRGITQIEETDTSRHKIVITEIPFQINKTSLIEKIAELARSNKIEGIYDLRDESDRRGMSINIELKRTAQPIKVLNQLYKFTSLQSTYGVQLLALVNGEPRLLPLKKALQVFIDHRRIVIARRSQYELNKAKARAHILDGLLIALANLDEVIKIIRGSKDPDSAKNTLMERFELSENQAQAILDMQLRRLSALERQKIEDEQKEILDRIKFLEDLLSSPSKVLSVIKDNLLDMTEKYGDDRRTRISYGITGEFREEDLIPDESILISITQRGYVKRVTSKSFRTQHRGGKGVTGHTTKDEDQVLLFLPARTHDTIMFFTDRGKVYSTKAYVIPNAQRTGKGTPIVNVLALEPDETVTTAVKVSEFDDTRFCTMATRRGIIKRVAMSKFESVRLTGKIAIKLSPGDELKWVRVTNGDDEVIMVTESGLAVKFHETKVRAMGRTAGGVIGIRLSGNDRVTSMEVAEPEGDLLVVTTGGFGKRTALSEYPLRNRGIKGVLTIDRKAIDRIGRITGARVVQEDDELTLISAGGVVLRTQMGKINRLGRATKGVVLMNLKDTDYVAGVARIAAADITEPFEEDE